MMRTTLRAAAFVSLLAIALPTQLLAESREKITIGFLDQTLRRLGETGTADRLKKEFDAGRIEFGDTGDVTTLGYVKAGWFGWGGPSSNWMMISEEALRAADSKRLYDKRPYGDSSNLVTYAGTVVHELVHLDQAFPEEAAKFEDPAYRRVEETYARWIAKLRNELTSARAGSPSTSRTSQIREIDDLLARISEDCGSQIDAVSRKVKEGKLSKGKSWRFDEYRKLISAVRAEISREPGLVVPDKSASVGASALGAKPSTPQKQPQGNPVTAPPPPVAKVGKWVLKRSERYDTNSPADAAAADAAHEHQLSVTSSMAQARFNWGGKRANVRCTWKGVPDEVRPGQIIDITVTGSDAGSEQGAGGFVGCRPLLFVLKSEGAQADLAAGGTSRETYGSAGQPVDEKKYSYPVPDGTSGQELILQFGVTSSIRGAGINLHYSYMAP